MSLLRTLESKIEGLVEGTFGRVFRSEVRPIELARKLAREMDEHRTFSVSRIYAPNEYDLWLSPEDRDHYEGIEEEVIDELCAYLLEHARREQLVLVGRPSISLHTDHRLSLGEFGIQTHPVRLDDHERANAIEPFADEGRYREGDVDPQADGETAIQRHPWRRSVAGGREKRQRGALLVLAGRRLVVPATGAVVGRSRECEVVLDDSCISRRHAQIMPSPDGWTIEDLGSTNGLRLNGRRVRGVQPLRPGDRIEMGTTEILFELR